MNVIARLEFELAYFVATVLAYTQPTGRVWHKAFFKMGPRLAKTLAYHSLKYLGLRRDSSKKRRQAMNLAPSWEG